MSYLMGSEHTESTLSRIQIARPDRPTEVVRQDRQREREKKTGKRGGGKSKEKASISIH
ncbi:hypothetical protein F9C07_5672 [Aspergillus flavus]|uniref:Uncharacterized protein n=1 Tax=Aspergillus flavus (strain ATCC 200026 / FGSC A1120 / IAM 13836 / NRRL 3357 / JCM 12722 / SRRC 167) TaxID=332952 RepID=A0A7U2MXD0_ASPFN|nr:hypothetical protein F9C07_5672 [Aspergillus flavus]